MYLSAGLGLTWMEEDPGRESQVSRRRAPKIPTPENPETTRSVASRHLPRLRLHLPWL